MRLNSGLNHFQLHRLIMRKAFIVLITVLPVIGAIILPGKFAVNQAGFRAANYFQDGMVLQRGNATIWGFGSAGQKVSWRLNDMTGVSVVADDGKWKVGLSIPESLVGGLHDVILESVVDGQSVKQVIRSVLVGEVWLCSGQSNMYMPLKQVFNGSNEMRSANKHTTIRLLQILPSQSDSPLDEPQIVQDWTVATAVTLRDFSALCYVTGRRLHESLGTPIGLIGCSYGGTPIRAWSPPQALAQCNTTQQHHSTNPSNPAINGPGQDSVLWNAMIAPLTILSIRGVLWYQGEADAEGDAEGYLCGWPAMIGWWREYFGNKDMPFGFVQLATKNRETEMEKGGTALVRWHQTADIGHVPNQHLPAVFMAVAMDLPDPQSPYDSIHPRRKEEVGDRLWRGAMSVAYDMSQVVFQGPLPKTIWQADDDNVTISFNQPVRFLETEPSLFQVCLGDKVDDWRQCPLWSTIKAQHKDANEVILQGLTGDKVVFVRYAWDVMPCDYLSCQIYSDTSSLPAAPFVLPLPFSFNL